MSRGLRHRLALMLGGEAIQSAFHFGLNIVLVRTLIASAIAGGDPAHGIRMVRKTGLLISGASAGSGAGLLLVRLHLFGGPFESEPLGPITGLLWLVSAASLSDGAPRIVLDVVGQYRFLAFVSADAAAVCALAVAPLLAVATPVWSLLGLPSSERSVRVARTGRSAPPRHPASLLAGPARAAWRPHSKDAPWV